MTRAGLVWLFLLAWPAAAQEETVEALLGRIEARCMEASTLRVSGLARVEAPGDGGSFEISIDAVFGRGNRVRLSTEGKLTRQEESEALSSSFVCDGVRCRYRDSMGHDRLDDASDELGRELRRALVRGGLLFVWSSVGNRELLEGEPLLSAFEFGPDLEENGRRLRTISWQLAFQWRGEETKASHSVRIDADSLEIVSREIDAQDGARIRESDLQARFGEEIPDSEFVLPE